MEPGRKMKLVDDQTKLSGPMKEYMKLIEKQNIERVQKLKRLKRNNILTGCLIGTGVLSIYLYSMFAVKQESFLDDFEEPKMKAAP